MPKKLERKLRKQAKEKGLQEKEQNAYIYGTLRKTGWKPKPKKKNKKKTKIRYY